MSASIAGIVLLATGVGLFVETRRFPSLVRSVEISFWTIFQRLYIVDSSWVDYSSSSTAFKSSKPVGAHGEPAKALKS